MTRGIEPGTGISCAHSSGTRSKPIDRAATAGNSERQVGGRGEDAADRPGRARGGFALVISRISSVVASRIAWGSSRSTLFAPSQGEESHPSDSVRAPPRAGARGRRRSGAATARGEAADLQRPEGGPPQRDDGCPTASHIRRTWRLRALVDRQLECARAEPTAHPRRGGRTVLERQRPRGVCGSPVRRRDPARALRRRSSVFRSGDVSAGWRARRRWSGGSGRWSRCRAVRPGTGAGHRRGSGRGPSFARGCRVRSRRRRAGLLRA